MHKNLSTYFEDKTKKFNPILFLSLFCLGTSVNAQITDTNEHLIITERKTYTLYGEKVRISTTGKIYADARVREGHSAAEVARSIGINLNEHT